MKVRQIKRRYYERTNTQPIKNLRAYRVWFDGWQKAARSAGIPAYIYVMQDGLANWVKPLQPNDIGVFGRLE